MEKENFEVMYFHGKTVDNVRFTMAGLIDNEMLVTGIAICSTEDQFCKERGRSIAAGRLLNQRNRPTHGRGRVSLYSDAINSEFKGLAGFPENYFVGKEIKVFLSYAKTFNYLTKQELQRQYGLFTYAYPF